MNSHTRNPSVLSSAFLLAATFSLSAQALTFTLTDLGTLGATYSYGSALNDHGQVTGYSSVDGNGSRAFYYDDVVGMRDLGVLNDTAYSSYGAGINNLGQITGNSGDRAFLTDGTSNPGTMRDLGTLANSTTYGFDVNDSGQVSGDSRVGTSEVHAIVSDGSGAPGSIIDLGTLGGTFSHGRAINNSGWVAGTSTLTNGEYHAFLSDGTAGNMMDIGTLYGGRTEAYDLNNLLQVVGDSSERAFVYDSVSGMTDLGTLGGGYSRAVAINDHGWIVGYSGLLNGPSTAFLYLDSLGGMVNINDYIDPAAAGWTLHFAQDVNNRGQIVGYGSFNGRYNHALLLTPDTPIVPVPEPASAGLLLLGMGGLGIRHLRQHTRKK